MTAAAPGPWRPSSTVEDEAGPVLDGDRPVLVAVVAVVIATAAGHRQGGEQQERNQRFSTQGR